MKDQFRIASYKYGKIHRVIRLSDNVEFSVGDTIGVGRPLGKITRIWESFEQLRADIGNLGIVLREDVIKF